MSTSSSSTADPILPPVPLRGVDLAAGWPTGIGGDSRLLGGGPPVRAVLDALADAVRPALASSPCGVAFSGGRDSTLLLAVALGVARREGLPAPVALTLRFPQDALSDECAWQERVVSLLGVHDWERVELAGELDAIGPFARRHLELDGVVWPFMAHASAPLYARVRGGALVTGEGGDEVLGGHRASVAAGLWRRRIRVSRSAVGTLASTAGPTVVRRHSTARRLRTALSWLRPATARRVARAVARDQVGGPWRLGRALDREDRLRSRRLGSANLAALAERDGVVLAQPLLDPGFQRALVARGGRFGWIDRTDCYRHLFAELLPPDVLARTSKAYFNDVYFTGRSRLFAAEWTGALPPDVEHLVDVGALRAEWAKARPHPSSFGLLQAAYLAGSTAGAVRLMRAGVVRLTRGAVGRLGRLAIAALMLGVVEIGQATLGTARSCRLLGIRLAGEGEESGPRPRFPVVAAPWVDAARTVVARRGPHGRCLRESLVVGGLLRRHRPVLRIGVARDHGEPLRAHAWIEIDGAAYDPSTVQYQPLRQVGG